MSQEPIWHQPCFVELLGAGELLPPQAAASPRANSFAEPLSLAAELLEQVLPQLGSSAASSASAAVSALQFGAQLARAAPTGASSSWTPKVLLSVLQQLMTRLRSTKDGEMVVVPAGWSATTGPITPAATIPSAASKTTAGGGGSGDGMHFGAILLALRRRSESTWDVVVCTASAGREYHPNYRTPLNVLADSFDPVLRLNGVSSDRLVDSAPWLALYRGIAFAHSSYEEGARHVYEVLLPYLIDAPLPDASVRSPPPPSFRRRPSPTADCSLISATLECVCGLLLLSGLPPLGAKRVELEVRVTYMRRLETQLAALADGPEHAASLSDDDSRRLCAACRGVARAAAAHGEHGSHEGAASGPRLLQISQLITRVSALADTLRARTAGYCPPLVLSPDPTEPAAAAFPYFGRTLREQLSVEHLAGIAPIPPPFRAVQLTAVLDDIRTPHDAVVAMQQVPNPHTDPLAQMHSDARLSVCHVSGAVRVHAPREPGVSHPQLGLPTRRSAARAHHPSGPAASARRPPAQRDELFLGERADPLRDAGAAITPARAPLSATRRRLALPEAHERARCREDRHHCVPRCHRRRGDAHSSERHAVRSFGALRRTRRWSVATVWGRSRTIRRRV